MGRPFCDCNEKKVKLNKQSVLYYSVLIFKAFSGILLLVSLYLNSGIFIYVLDDPYIHMTIARNFSEYGLWAVNGLQFSSATSSPLWSLLIAGVFFITGSNVIVPFMLNIIFSAAVIFTVWKILNSFGLQKHSFVFMLIFIFATPLPALVFTGMEHIAQILAALFFVILCSRYVIKENKISLLYITLLAAVLTALRYEDIFLVFSVSLVLALRRKYAAALLIFMSGVIPVILYGLISTSHNWMFLPNPLLIKTRVWEFTLSGIAKIPLRAVKRISEPDIFFLVPPVIFIFTRNMRAKVSVWNEKQIIFVIFLITYLLHMTFAQTGWFFRYEAYLVSIGLIAIWLNIYEYLPEITDKQSHRRLLKTAAMIIIFISIGWRSVSSFLVPQSSNNIYNQHYQMAMYVNTLPEKTIIAANDIGMLNYYTRNYIVDLWGLADIDAAKLKLTQGYDTEKISWLAKEKNVKLAVVYKDWFGQYGGISAGWEKIGEWKMNQLNIVNGNETVSFYSLDSVNTGMFSEKLEDFSKMLPQEVIFVP